MDNHSVAFSTQRSTPYQDTIISAEGRSSIRDPDDVAMLASFLGAKSDLFLSQTVSLTSLITANKAPFEIKPPSPRKRPSPLENQWHDRAKSAYRVSESGRSSIRRALSATSRAKSPNDTSCNIGNSLYFRGMQMKENVKRKAQEWLQSERKAEKGYFKPQVDSYSSLLQPRLNTRVEEMLLTWGERRDHKLAQMKTSRTEDELRPCSFTPQLDYKSMQINEKARTNAQPRFIELYELAMKRNNEKKQHSDCSFHPKIFAEKRVAETQEEFIKRLFSSKTRPGEDPTKHEKVVETEPSQVLKKPVYRSNRYNQPIHDYLYSLKDKKFERVKSAPPEEETDNSASHKVFQRFQHACIAKVFAVLDSGRQGTVSGDLRQAEGLTEKQRIILEPVLKEIRTSGEKWGLERFTQRVEELVATLTVEERGYLLTRVKTSAEEQKPAAPKPRKSASGLTPRLLSDRTSEVPSTQKTTQAKAKFQAERSAKESKECSFKPFLSSLETQRYVARKSITQ